MCHSIVFLKGDQGQAIIDLQESTGTADPKRLEEIMRDTQFTSALEDEMAQVSMNPLVGGSKANGAIECAIKRLQGQVRTVRVAMEEAIGRSISADPQLWQWLVECCVDTFN